MKISEAKDILLKYEACWLSQLEHTCDTVKCGECIFDITGKDLYGAQEVVRDYYIKKHVRAQKKDFMLEVQSARLRKKVE